jgi:hypothetical protein
VTGYLFTIIFRRRDRGMIFWGEKVWKYPHYHSPLFHPNRVDYGKLFLQSLSDTLSGTSRPA